MRTWHVHLRDGDGIPVIVEADTFFMPAGERPVHLVLIDEHGRPCAAFEPGLWTHVTLAPGPRPAELMDQDVDLTALRARLTAIGEEAVDA